MLTKSLFSVYDVINTSEDPVTLRIEIGYGQLAQTLIYLEDNKIGDFSDTFAFEIGLSKDLVRKELTILTSIHDIQPDTDRIFMQLEIIGGKKEELITVFDTSVSQPGGLAHAQIIVIFI